VHRQRHEADVIARGQLLAVADDGDAEEEVRARLEDRGRQGGHGADLGRDVAAAGHQILPLFVERNAAHRLVVEPKLQRHGRADREIVGAGQEPLKRQL
jgi:hypothetical protein